MSIDNQREQYEIDDALSMISNSTARALDEPWKKLLKLRFKTLFAINIFFASSKSELKFSRWFSHEPGLHGVEDSQHDLSFKDLEGGSLPQHVQGETAAETSDEQVSRSDYNRFLCDARRSSMSVVELEMPWHPWFSKQFLGSDEESFFYECRTCSATRTHGACCNKRCRVVGTLGHFREAYS